MGTRGRKVSGTRWRSQWDKCVGEEWERVADKCWRKTQDSPVGDGFWGEMGSRRREREESNAGRQIRAPEVTIKG